MSLAKVPDSELHVAHVGPVVPEDFAPTYVEPARMQREARRILNEQVAKIETVGHRRGGTPEDGWCLSIQLDPESRRQQSAGFELKKCGGKIVWERPDTGFWVSQEMAPHHLESKSAEEGRRA